VAFLVFRSSSRSGEATQDASSSKLNLMMQDVAKKRAELARSRLEAGQYEDALEKAQEALNYDANQPEAKAVAQKAREIKDRVEKAIAAARPSGAAPNPAGRAAFWDLLQAAPDKKEATDFASAYEGALRDEAEKARGLMDAAQQSARAAHASELDEFKTATRLERDAETAFKEGRFASAAKDFMRARRRFERAQGLAGGAG
jgi:tetratricopeptide (TPR) repeat protein